MIFDCFGIGGIVSLYGSHTDLWSLIASLKNFFVIIVIIIVLNKYFLQYSIYQVCNSSINLICPYRSFNFIFSIN